jgi:hypothetical protein
MIFDFPRGNSTVMFNIKSKTKDFFPILYYRIYHGQEAHSIVFPPSELVDSYHSLTEPMWDKDMYLLRHTEEIVNAQEDAGLALNLVYNLKGNNKITFD